MSVGIIRQGGDVVHDPVGKANELGKHWGEVFRAKPVALHEGVKFLEEHNSPLDLPDLPLPSIDDFRNCLRKLTHSAPGPDGIPYGCWKSAPSTSALVLHRGLRALALGKAPPHGFNDSIGYFIPKGVLEEDKYGTNRKTLTQGRLQRKAATTR